LYIIYLLPSSVVLHGACIFVTCLAPTKGIQRRKVGQWNYQPRAPRVSPQSHCAGNDEKAPKEGVLWRTAGKTHRATVCTTDASEMGLFLKSAQNASSHQLGTNLHQSEMDDMNPQSRLLDLHFDRRALVGNRRSFPGPGTCWRKSSFSLSHQRLTWPTRHSNSRSSSKLQIAKSCRSPVQGLVLEKKINGAIEGHVFPRGTVGVPDLIG